MREPRHHHHVTAGHLAGFTDKGTKKGKLFVLSLSEPPRWRGPLRPDEVASRRDFNRVEIPDVDPYYVEKFLGELLDGPAAEVMRSITERPRIPSDEEMNILVNFVSMQMVRGPKFRERAGRALVENVAAAIGEETKTREGFNKLVDEMRAAGKLEEEVTHEELQELIREAPELLQPNRTTQVAQMLRGMDRLFQLNRERFWVFAVSNGPDFVCSDSPVTAIAQRPPVNPHARHASLAMPLSKSVALVGAFRPPRHPLISADSDYVANMNRATAHDATELYARAAVVHGMQTPLWSARPKRK